MKTKTLYLLMVLSLLSFFSGYAQDNIHLDCDDALVVCDNQNITIWNNTFGTQELDASNNGCLNGNEHESIWLTFTISSGTTLDFDIIPNTTGDDYDFAIYGPNIDCDNLPLPIRCDYDLTSGNTGLSAAAGFGYDTTLNVQAGETYYLLIDNHPAGDQANGFTINWGGNAVLNCCPPSISSGFTLDYFCHDGVYDVTVTANDPVPSQWWRVYETSVEGSTSDADTIGTASGIQGGTTTTFTNLDPDNFYYIKHGVWIPDCFTWQETRIALDRDCCIDEFEIIPYCEDPCVLDSFPLKVKDQNGDIITVLDGAMFSWFNATTGATSNSDIVTAAEFDHWFLTLTMPDGCIYRLEYMLICCEDDIQLEAYDCPTDEDLKALEAQLEAQKLTLDKKTYNKYLNYLNTFKGDVSAEDCDPCEDGLFIIRVVDGNGDLLTDFVSITWSDGLYANENIRWGEVNTTYVVTVVVLASNGVDTCTYTDEIIYECREECADLPAPTNLQNNGATLSWNAVPGAESYIVSSPSVIRIECCRVGVSIAPIPTTNTFVPLSTGLQSRCFVWQVTAVCADGSLSPVSVQSCHLPTQIVSDGGDVRDKVSIYPNPNNGNMDIKVELKDASDVTLNVYRFDGTLVRTIKNPQTPQLVLDMNFKSNLPSGVYFFTFNTSNGSITKRVIIK